MAYNYRWWENRIPPEIRRQVRLSVSPVNRNLPGHRPHWGNLKRAKPFSDCYGLDRGLPVDRVYIERFLERMSSRIRGDVLEVRSPDYTHRFGAADHRTHIVDIEPTNRAATVIGDLCDPHTLSHGSYDCAIVTQTLQFVSSPDMAVANIYESLRSGGTMLITVPCAARIDGRAPESDYWRWTPEGLRAMMDRHCDGAEVEVEGGGNLIATLAAMLGCAVEDLRPQDLADNDPVFPIIACAAVTKPSPS